MKLLFTLLLIVGLSFANYTIFGPAGAPPGVITPTWIGDGLTASAELDMKGDTLAIISTTPGDADIYLNFQEADGTKHLLAWDDGTGRWDFGSSVNVTGAVTASGNIEHGGGKAALTSVGAAGYLYSILSDFVVDVNVTGSGTIQLGQTGDNDVTLLQSNLRGAYVSVSADYTLGVAECIYLECTTASTIDLPTSPTTGDTYRIKFTHASGGTLDGNGNTIDGNATISASENDAYLVAFNGTEWGIW